MLVDDILIGIRTLVDVEIQKLTKASEANGDNDNSDNKSNIAKMNVIKDMSDDTMLIFIDISLKVTASKVNPNKLIETSGSDAPVLKYIDEDHYVRVPQYPEVGKHLDIDETLAYAIKLNTLSTISENLFQRYESEAEAIISAYDMVDPLLRKREEEILPYFRFSADKDEWHDTFQDGDIYIKFKIDEDTWSDPSKFVGDDGEDGSGDFTGLSDTPDSLEANKLLMTNDDGDAIIFGEVPKTNPDFDKVTGEDSISGDIHSSFLYDGSSEYKATHYYFASDDANIIIETYEDDEGDKYLEMEQGRKYIWYVFPDNHTVTFDIDSDAARLLGSLDVPTDKEVTFFEVMYDGADLIVLNTVSY